LIAYLSPVEGGDPFVGIREALAGVGPDGASDWRTGALPDLTNVPLGPRTSHDPARGSATLAAYRQWVERTRGAAGGEAGAFAGDPAWSPTRRFERLFERLTLPGLGRAGRYELLVALGRLGLYDLEGDSLHFADIRGAASGDPTTVAAKRVFGIGDPVNLERRALALAQAVRVPVEALDLALANWGTGERATLGVPPELRDEQTLAEARAALGL
jgi:hypothetical protein